jgi:hypothetical protein
MNSRTLPVFIGLILAVAIPHASHGQVTLSGMVADSATMQALPDVNVVNKKTGNGAVSDIRGGFSLQASDGDSIIFSRVGYKTRILPVTEIRKLVIVFMKEEQRMLNTVEILDQNKQSWLPEIPAGSPWQNPASGRQFTESPGFQGVQTFGPGYVFKGAFSRFSKEEKEKRKLVRVQEENYRAGNYVDLVNDPEVKGKIMKDHLLSEEEYYDLLARFNQEHGNSIYGLEDHEIIALLLRFYSDNVQSKQ